MNDISRIGTKQLIMIIVRTVTLNPIFVEIIICMNNKPGEALLMQFRYLQWCFSWLCVSDSGSYSGSVVVLVGVDVDVAIDVENITTNKRKSIHKNT